MNRFDLPARRIAAVAAILLSFCTFASAQNLRWTGGTAGTNTNWTTAGNWVGSTLPTATSDLEFSTLANTTFPTLILGQDWTIRSITANNASAQYSASNGFRIVSTTSTTSNAARTLTFGTAGTIVTALNNANISFRAASLSGNSTASPIPALTVNLGFTGQGIVNAQDTSIVLFAEGSNNAPGAIVTGTGGITKNGSGTLRMNDTHTFSGDFILQEGTTLITGNSNQSNGTVNFGPLGTGTVYLLGGNLSANSTTGNRLLHNPVVLGGTVDFFKNTTSGVLTISTVANKTTTLSANSTINNEGTLLWNQTIGGNFGLTKGGNGLLSVNAANTYSGDTLVNSGTLRVNGSVVGSVSVSAAATLTGNGTIGGSVIMDGTHNPGSTFGTQTIAGDLTYRAGSAAVIEIGANTATLGDTRFDQVVVGGNLNFLSPTPLTLVFNAPGSTVSWADPFWDTNQSWQIYTAASVSNFANLTLNSTEWLDGSIGFFSTSRPGAAFNFNTFNGAIYLNYAVAPVPEPATYAALLGTVGLGYALYRRRRNRS